MKRVKGFTLSEVLIVMTVIGVLAALTVPTLIGNTDVKKKNTFFKKGFSTLSSAYSTYFALNSKPTQGTAAAGGDILFKALTEKLTVDYFYTFGEGNAVTKSYENPYTMADTTGTGYYSTYWIRTTDGMAYLVGIAKSNQACGTRLEVNKETTLAKAKKKTCLFVTVDYNAEKSPNTNCASGAGITEGSTITDGDIDKIGNCDQISFLVTTTGITAGNPDTTVAGHIIGE